MCDVRLQRDSEPVPGRASPVAAQAANAVTLLRLLLTPLFVLAVFAADDGAGGWPAALLFTLIAASDLLDGHLARRFGTASARGRLLDHAADIVFLLSAYGAYVAIDAVPWWVPAAIAASFAVYIVDSLRRSGTRPRLLASRAGHVGGIANYVLIGVLIGNRSLGLAWLPPAVMLVLFAAVPVYSGLSIADRLRARR